MKNFKTIFRTLNFILFALLYFYIECGSQEKFVEGLIFLLLIALVSFPVCWILKTRNGFENKINKKSLLTILYIVFIVGNFIFY